MKSFTLILVLWESQRDWACGTNETVSLNPSARLHTHSHTLRKGWSQLLPVLCETGGGVGKDLKDIPQFLTVGLIFNFSTTIPII